jgi:hypothetical protein
MSLREHKAFAQGDSSDGDPAGVAASRLADGSLVIPRCLTRALSDWKRADKAKARRSRKIRRLRQA